MKQEKNSVSLFIIGGKEIQDKDLRADWKWNYISFVIPHPSKLIKCQTFTSLSFREGGSDLEIAMHLDG